MRLRSSQFVVLLLIACSVQVREDSVLRWMAQAIAESAIGTSQPRELAGEPVRREQPVRPSGQRSGASPRLRVAALFCRQPWVMSPPASHATAVAAYTSLHRA